MPIKKIITNAAKSPATIPAMPQRNSLPLTIRRKVVGLYGTTSAQPKNPAAKPEGDWRGTSSR